jgi:hypothetical protein
MEVISSLDSLFAIALAIMALSGICIKYLKMYFQKGKVDSIKLAFESIVNKLGSENEAEKYAAAILLRRFFDPKSELGVGNTPYSQEAIDVIASLLRKEKRGDFQKILADNLKYAPSLEGADLQRINLQNAYLSGVNLKSADFFNADLSFSSLKKCNSQKAVFYQARLQETVLSEGDFQNANFMESDLKGVKFDKAIFEGANFKGARNIPYQIRKCLDENGVYRESSAERVGMYDDSKSKNVFISKPGKMTIEQEFIYNHVCTFLSNDGYKLCVVEVEDYQNFGILSEIKRVINGCHGVVLFGFKQYKVQSKVFRWWDDNLKREEPNETFLTSPWIHTEAGIASAFNLPLLLVSDFNIESGIFESILAESLIYKADSKAGFDKVLFEGAYKSWSNCLATDISAVTDEERLVS